MCGMLLTACCTANGRDVRFSRPDQLKSDTISVYGSDANGWIHLQIKLGNLVDPTELKTPSAIGYNRLVFRDVSGDAGQICT